MGRQRRCDANLGKESGTVCALLEAQEIVLRGDIAAKLPLSTLRALHAKGDDLLASTGHGRLRLALGAKEAAAWLARIQDPPSLSRKLGVEAGTPVHVVGDHPEARAVLAAAEARFVPLHEAALVFVAIESEAQLAGLQKLVREKPPAAPLWILRPKGKQAAVKESTIMDALKVLGLAPSKTSAWSEAYAADRYGKARSAVR